jgi:metal-responsive CopG/Arc/MetJ family transcriptional regulator
MKTAISVPDDIFAAADRLAKRLKKSRSRLYSEALGEYLARHAPDEITEALNSTLDQARQQPDRWASSAARRVLERTEW